MHIPQLGLDVDPLLLSILAGIIWTPIQAALDRPWWTPTRRRILVLAAAVVLAVIVWFAGAYPATWQLILTQVGVILGAATAAFTLLKSWGVIDWIGRVTPGGETTIPKHAAGITPETMAVTPSSSASATGAADTRAPQTTQDEGEDQTA